METEIGGVPEPQQRVVINPLTPRELQVLTRVAHGRVTREIADELNITRGTAQNHMESIRDKLGVRSAVEAVLVSFDCGILDPDKIDLGVSREAIERLTGRERGLLEMRGDLGDLELSKRSVAERASISVGTVSNHFLSIRRKLGIQRTDIAVFAYAKYRRVPPAP